MKSSRLTLPLDETLTSLKPSRTLKKLARRLGVKIKNPVAFDPQSGSFESGEDWARDKASRDEADLGWLLESAQREEASPIDEAMLPSFLRPYATTEPKCSPDVLRKVRKLAVAICRSVRERGTWEFPVHSTHRVVTWSGPYAVAAFRTNDWQTAFCLRAAELVAAYSGQLRKCARAECGRLFVAVKRQAYCSSQCSQSARFAKYWNSLSAKKRREKRHQQYVKQVEKERGPGVAEHVRRRAPKGE